MKELMMELKQELTYNVMDELLEQFYKKPSKELYDKYYNTMMLADKLGYYEYDNTIDGDFGTLQEMLEELK